MTDSTEHTFGPLLPVTSDEKADWYDFHTSAKPDREASEHLDRFIRSREGRSREAERERVIAHFRPYYPCELPGQCGADSWECGNCQFIDSVRYPEAPHA